MGLALSGAVRVDVVVSQGCRPIGPPLEITRATQNLVLEFDGQPALERVEQVLQTLAASEQESLEHGLYVGRPVSAGAEGRGDYVIRNLLGADRTRGAIAIADFAHAREKLRLHVRDAGTAREDLEMLLSPQAFDSGARRAVRVVGASACTASLTAIAPLQEALMARYRCRDVLRRRDRPVGGEPVTATVSIVVICPRDAGQAA